MNLGEVLEGIADFEVKLESYYASVRDESGSNGVRLLVYFLGRNRRRIQSIVEACSAEMLDGIKAEKVGDNLACNLVEALETAVHPPKQVDAAQLLELADNLDGLCLNYYKEVIQVLSDGDAINLLDRFIDLKQAERTMLQKMSAVDY